MAPLGFRYCFLLARVAGCWLVKAWDEHLVTGLCVPGSCELINLIEALLFGEGAWREDE